MAALTTSRTSDIRTRVEDYLDDKFQTAGDLDDVDGLLIRVQEQQQLLKKQLEDAQEALAEADQNARQHEEALQQQAERYQREQSDIDRRLKIITDSEVSDDAVKKFESRMTKLRRLEVAQGYLGLLQEVDGLSTGIRQNLKTDPRSALQSYRQLRSVANGLSAAQPAAEGAAPHLIDQVEQQTNAIHTDLKIGLVKDFRQTLERMNWPQKELSLLGGLVSNWSDQAQLLLELQEPDLLASQANQPLGDSSEATTLLPIEVMVQPLAMRFQYHFYGERPTNRLDKPEYFLSHVLDLLDRHSSFMTEMFQPVLDARVQAKDDLELVYTDAISAFITGLLPMVMKKCLSVLPQISSQPQLLSHLVHELMSFDTTLRDSWGYSPFAGVFTEWKGLTWSVLTSHNYFNAWLGVERDFALTRYRTIRDAPDSGDIDYDGVDPGQTKPTKGTIRVNDLLETVTDRYRSLTSFSQKMKFLMGIQLSIFDDYHNHLHGALQAYLASSHTAGRLLQGQSKSEALGEKALASLSKIFGSAEFLERKMSDWSEDIFFLELWDELQDRARTNSGSTASLGQDLSVEDVAAKTSATIKRSGSSAGVESESGALFDETQLSYRRLRDQAEVEILHLLDANIRDALRPFSQVEAWASLSTTVSDPAALAPSASLDNLLEAISSLLGFLSKVLAPAPLRRVTKHFCSTVQKETYDNVLLKHNFSAAGTTQLKRDIRAVEDTVDASVSARGWANVGIRKLNQAVALLGLPIRASSAPAAFEEEDGWDFDADEGENAEDVAERFPNFDEDKVWGLWEAEKMIYKSNESARQALSEMGLDHLSETDARNIISRRVEINS